MIPFNKPCVIGKETIAIQQALANEKITGNGPFSKKCTNWLEGRLGCEKAILTPSCTAALEMTALLTEVGEGDEVIMPSYTFVSTANAFALRGASIRFIDVDPLTMNIDPRKIKAAITEQTRAIVVVHYAGIGCDMNEIMKIAERYGLWVIEDAAQGLMSSYNDQPLGTIGHFGTISFHETKNYNCGEGGALLINDASTIERAEILQEKGTNRSQFIRGRVDKYTWRDIGSSFLLSDINAAFLSVQLDHAEQINEDRIRSWERYKEGLQPLIDDGKISGPLVPEACEHNGHMFYIKTKDEAERTDLIDFLEENHITAVTHYVPLHSAYAGKKFGKFIGQDNYTTSGSEKILRLPIYYEIGEEAVTHVVNTVHKFYEK
ncbi:dTDP-4-amino-4,6-dideoxygalactose transaminase [Virgibacillus profundi]|uniref:dTDP-4-amino-4,6-dideoxygalactose transaminase n=1 Tax=Virgibacillus profundi TaxID=2024555 RepID=A0A2A2IHW5_9BACI|nr:dTDP-4-amino-4,6-dideoxygalactose transaminase [Virgibacillus profundi]PAV30906.1 dTDP-4-amino-4,6-dideoxygalactose transaminase [Virgibacillus profundi]PXY55090.1 dTDP-4-amino-4,6-dideoxygalactose transaminase [Virgibacillus profundi]